MRFLLTKLSWHTRFYLGTPDSPEEFMLPTNECLQLGQNIIEIGHTMLPIAGHLPFAQLITLLRFIILNQLYIIALITRTRLCTMHS